MHYVNANLELAVSMVSGLLVVGCGALAPVTDGGPVNTDASSADEKTDTGTTCSAHVPMYHRANAVSCPTARGPGNALLDAGSSAACNQDSDCTMGKNGRCLRSIQDWGNPLCSYDECDVDSDCPGNVACVCRASATDSAPNLCASGSGCRLDSDCGLCGYCSPSGNPFFPPPLYFCHTADDTCTDDSDCSQTLGSCQNGCNYNPQAGHWSCTPECPP